MKSFYSAILITLVLFTISCKQKEYTCVCSGGFTGSHYTEETIEAPSRNRADAKCTKDNPSPRAADAVYCNLQEDE